MDPGKPAPEPRRVTPPRPRQPEPDGTYSDADAWLEHLLAELARLASLIDPLPDPDTPLGQETIAFFENNWKNAQEGLLARTKRLRVVPQAPFAPRTFRFEVDCRYKRKAAYSAEVELVDGTLRGTIAYRPDILLASDEEPSVAVLIDRDQGFVHCNYSRQFGILCTGDVPGGPLLPFDALLLHVYSIVTYQNMSVSHAADSEAALYFASDPEAMAGLENVPPLY